MKTILVAVAALTLAACGHVPSESNPVSWKLGREVYAASLRLDECQKTRPGTCLPLAHEWHAARRAAENGRWMDINGAGVLVIK